jgi:uncharacterized protein
MWTDESEDHIARHHVTPTEVEQVVYSRRRAEEPNRDQTTKVFGTTDAGRYLAILLTGALDGRDYVVTARDMTDTERRAFRRKKGGPPWTAKPCLSCANSSTTLTKPRRSNAPR